MASHATVAFKTRANAAHGWSGAVAMAVAVAREATSTAIAIATAIAVARDRKWLTFK